jgi:hypothetical protein
MLVDLMKINVYFPFLIGLESLLQHTVSPQVYQLLIRVTVIGFFCMYTCVYQLQWILTEKFLDFPIRIAA